MSAWLLPASTKQYLPLRIHEAKNPIENTAKMVMSSCTAFSETANGWREVEQHEGIFGAVYN